MHSILVQVSVMFLVFQSHCSGHFLVPYFIVPVYRFPWPLTYQACMLGGQFMIEPSIPTSYSTIQDSYPRPGEISTSTKGPVAYSALINNIDTLMHHLKVKFSIEENVCLKNRTVLYEPDGKCYSKFTSGPCGDSEVLVYDKEEFITSGRLQAACKRCQRPVEGLPDDAIVCYPSLSSDPERCPEGVVEPNVFGERKCRCGSGFFRVAGRGGGRCFPMYRRGPCDVGSVVTPTFDLVQVDRAECRRDPCSRPGRGAGSGGAIPVDVGSGRIGCYQLRTRGPCPNTGPWFLDVAMSTPSSPYFPGCFYRGRADQ